MPVFRFVVWTVYFHAGAANDDGGRFAPSLSDRARAEVARVRLDRYTGQPFVLDECGRPDRIVNKFFASRGFRGYAAGTRKKYALSIGLWLNFCGTRGLGWDAASPDDVADFKFWRMTDEGNPARVGGSAMHGDIAAITSLYRWAATRYGIADPVLRHEDPGYGRARGRGQAARPDKTSHAAVEPAGIRDRDVKWLDPAAVRRWIDVGLRGLDLDGREPDSTRNRNGTRNAAFAELLYGTGLRVSEAASMLDLELPDDSDPGRAYFTCRLAAACAKGDRPRLWWLPRRALSEVLVYLEGQRPEAVARAQREGRYEGLDRLRIIEDAAGARRVALSGEGGRTGTVPLDELGPDSRLRLFRRTDQGLEPAALWLNENGIPRPAQAWEKTFRMANARIGKAGLPWFRCTPHMLRHSFALRWYSVGRLLWDRRLAHLTEGEQRDFRAQFGDTWQFVQTLLGHAHPQTTVDIYLEPFKSLEVSLLLECAAGLPLPDLMRAIFDTDGRILHDPVAR